MHLSRWRVRSRLVPRHTLCQAVLASTLKEAAPHIMHTRDGARIASCCIRFSDPKDRKTVLKVCGSMHGMRTSGPCARAGLGSLVGLRAQGCSPPPGCTAS